MSTNFFNSNKIAIFTDLHLGVHQNSKAWHQISLEWAKWFRSKLIERNIKDIVFCGDYFHARDEISVDTLHVGTTLLKMFSDFNVTMITGNHDCYLKESSEIHSLSQFECWENVTVVDKYKLVESHGKRISFVPWGIKHTEIKKCDIIFGHFEINLFKMNSYAICDHGINSSDLLCKSPLVVTGHFHLRDQRTPKGGVILYAGNPFQMDFNDAGSDKGFYILDVECGELDFTQNTISPEHKKISLSKISLKDVDIKDSFVKLKVDCEITPDELDKVLVNLRQQSPRQLTIEYDKTSQVADENTKVDLSGIDISEAIREFVNLMEIPNKESIVKLTLSIYEDVKK